MLYLLPAKKVVADPLKPSYLDWISEMSHDGEGNEQGNNDKVVLLQRNGSHS